MLIPKLWILKTVVLKYKDHVKFLKDPNQTHSSPLNA